MSYDVCERMWQGKRGNPFHKGMCICTEIKDHEGRCVCKCGTQAFFRAYKLKPLELSPVPYKRRKAAR